VHWIGIIGVTSIIATKISTTKMMMSFLYFSRKAFANFVCFPSDSMIICMEIRKYKISAEIKASDSLHLKVRRF
jgi:hypothetical protein